ncbi:hypothetical protein D3C71_1637170 [compost metagenome]
MQPFSSTKMVWACKMVESRWAMRMVMRVLSVDRRRTVSVICSSVSESSADVASSKISSGGCRTSARAIDRRCFSPPDRRTPISPMGVSSPSGALSSKCEQAACCMAAMISASVASGFTTRMFSRTVPAKRCVSCVRKPIWRRTSLKRSWVVLMPL